MNRPNGFRCFSSPRQLRMLHVMMALVACLALACCFFVRNTIADSLEGIAIEREECQSAIQSRDQVVQAVAASEKRHADLSEEYRSLLNRFPKKIVDSDVLAAIRGLAQSTRCNLVDFRPGEIQKQTEYQSRIFDIRLEGRFIHLFSFFESMPTIPYGYQLSRIKISEPSVAGGACRVELNMKVLFDHVWATTESTP